MESILEANFHGLNADQSKLYALFLYLTDVTINKLLVHAVKEFHWSEKKFHKTLKQLVSKGFVSIEEQ